MKIAHCVFYSPAFIPQQILLLNQWFSGIDQTFFIYGAPKAYLEKAPSNVRFLKKFDQDNFIAEALRADRIVFNNLFEKITLVLANYSEIVTKGIWIPWGPDLNNRQEYIPDSRRKQMGMAFYRQFVRRLYGIATPVQGDYDLIRRWYRTPARYINAAPNIFSFEKKRVGWHSGAAGVRKPCEYPDREFGRSEQRTP